MTILMEAVYCGCLDIIKILLSKENVKRVKINTRDKHGRTALFWSNLTLEHKEEIVKLLLQAGAEN